MLEPLYQLEALPSRQAERAEVANVHGKNSAASRVFGEPNHSCISEIRFQISMAGKDLSHFHLCDTNRCTFGSGHLDFRKVFRTLSELEYDGYCTVISESEDWNFEAETAMQLISGVLTSRDNPLT